MKLVSCLTATYGRYTQLCRALSCWLDQDYPHKELVILNTHPEPVTTPFPGVRVYNEPDHNDLGSCRNRLLELAAGEYINTWDDDDWWFPWHLSQAMARIGDAPGWKPARSWFYHGHKNTLEPAGNAFEASIVFRKDAVVKKGYRAGQGDEHSPLLEIPITVEEVGPERMSYVYTWGAGMHHASGSLGSDLPLDVRVKQWKEAHQDTGAGKPLEYVSMDFLKLLREEVLR